MHQFPFPNSFLPSETVIKQIEIYKSPVKLKEPFIISLGAFEYAENIIVKIVTNDGITGFGECSPFPSIHGETMQTAFIVGGILGKLLIGKDPLNIAALSAEMDKGIYANTSIKSAFDIALYDIAAQTAGLPLYKFLGGNNNKLLQTDYTVSIADPFKMAVEALKIKDAGFPFIKVKLGGKRDEDIRRIALIRESVGNDIPLRIDANQGWNFEDAVHILNALEKYTIQHCEEPLPRWAFMELGKLRGLSPVPIMADETICDEHDAKRLIDLKACDYFNIKLGKSSGIYKALKIIRLAEEAGIKMQVGGFLESRLGFTAAAHLALCSADIIYCDFDTPLMFVEDPVSGGIRYGENGKIWLPETPGLGAWIGEDYLKRLHAQVIN
jgi:L-Ala-D/L-Glu epimerase